MSSVAMNFRVCIFWMYECLSVGYICRSGIGLEYAWDQL